MFSDILKSGIPLISVTYRDTVNVNRVVQHYAGTKPVKHYNNISAKNPEKDTIYYRVAEAAASGEAAAAMYSQLSKINSQLVYVNLPNPPRVFFGAGELPTPIDMARNLLMGKFNNEDFVTGLMPALGGLTLQEVLEVVKIAQAKYGGINSSRLARTRALVMPPMNGLSIITGSMPFYKPNKEWASFVEREKMFFFSDMDHRLRPKGALLDGLTGTGKTLGVKYLAQKWGLPLYRLDTTFKGKYVGQTENQLTKVFKQVEAESPCILLVDEAEKIFGGDSQGDPTHSNALSIFLWWMQEREGRIFTVFTTNATKSLPPELTRDGRLDFKFEFKGLSKDEGVPFMKSICQSFDETKGMSEEGLALGINSRAVKLYTGVEMVSHSTLVQAAKEVVKGQLLASSGTPTDNSKIIKLN